jgi:hypothetical protein
MRAIVVVDRWPALAKCGSLVRQVWPTGKPARRGNSFRCADVKAPHKRAGARYAGVTPDSDA